MIHLLLVLTVTGLQHFGPLHKFLYGFNSVENDMKFKMLHRVHDFPHNSESVPLNDDLKIFTNKFTEQTEILGFTSFNLPREAVLRGDVQDGIQKYPYSEILLKQHLTNFLKANEDVFQPLNDFMFALDGSSKLANYGPNDWTMINWIHVLAINKKTKATILESSLWSPEAARWNLTNRGVRKYCPKSIDRFMVNGYLDNIITLLLQNKVPSDVKNLLHKCVRLYDQKKFKKAATYLLQKDNSDSQYLKNVADINEISDDMSAFHVAINTHNAEFVSLMMENKNPDLASYGKPIDRNSQHRTFGNETCVNIIHLALWGHPYSCCTISRKMVPSLMETLKILLKALGDKKFDLLNDKTGRNALNYAAEYLPFYVVELLVENGANVLQASDNKLYWSRKYGGAFRNVISKEETDKIQHYLNEKLEQKLKQVKDEKKAQKKARNERKVKKNAEEKKNKKEEIFFIQ